jgi:hypothetical protein
MLSAEVFVATTRRRARASMSATELELQIDALRRGFDDEVRAVERVARSVVVDSAPAPASASRAVALPSSTAFSKTPRSVARALQLRSLTSYSACSIAGRRAAWQCRGPSCRARPQSS